MHGSNRLSVVAIVIVALTPSILALVQSPPKRVVTLSVLRPNAPEDTRPSLITALEDGMATLGIPDVGRFGFTPSFAKGDAKTVVITIFDASAQPARELGRVEVVVGDEPVESRTTPSFVIGVTRVTRPK
jgi:hypothetical protein